MNSTTTTTLGAATLGGAVGVLATWVIGLFGLDVPAEVGGAISTLFTGVFSLFFPLGR